MRRLALILLVSLLALPPLAVSAQPARDVGAGRQLSTAQGLNQVSLSAPAQESPEGDEQEVPRQTPPVAAADGHPAYGVADAHVSPQATELGITWERVVFSWPAFQKKGPDDWEADFVFPISLVDRERARGIEIVPVLQFTPDWAAMNKKDGERSVPNLDDWGRFTARIASYYKGKIDKWIIWNEPEFRQGDQGAGQSFTWFGTDEEYYQLLKRAYRAIKSANPGATVVFGGTSYWVDINSGRQPFFKRILGLMAADPEAPANSWFFDAVALNIYWCPDDILRIYKEMKDAMAAKGIDKPIWLTETNAMPYDDLQTPKPENGQRVPMQVQADYAIQSLAIASAAGYQRYGWYRQTDGGVWREQEVWGLQRDDLSRRPVFNSFGTGVRLFTGATRVTFMPLERAGQPFGTPWPWDPNSYYPNWLIYQVVFDYADGKRVTVLWNATGETIRVRIPKLGSRATFMDKYGAEKPAAEQDGWYVVDLGGATVHGPFDPADYHYIGGPPIMVVENGVPTGSPIQEPRLGDPGSSNPGLQISLDPGAAKFYPGESARFRLRLRGIEGFNSQVQLSLPPLPPGLRVEMPATAYPGERVQVRVFSELNLEANLYVFPLTASGGDVSTSTDLVLEVPAPGT